VLALVGDDANLHIPVQQPIKKCFRSCQGGRLIEIILIVKFKKTLVRLRPFFTEQDSYATNANSGIPANVPIRKCWQTVFFKGAIQGSDDGRKTINQRTVQIQQNALELDVNILYFRLLCGEISFNPFVAE